MFRHTYQTGCLSILYSLRGKNPLQSWKRHGEQHFVHGLTGNEWGCISAYGDVKSVRDEDIESYVVEIMGANVQMTGITCPRDNSDSLAVRLPFFVMIVKNMKRYFMFEVEVIDDKNKHRRFIASNFRTATRVGQSVCLMPVTLDVGWNQVHFDLPGCTRLAYGTNYRETVRVRVFANCRIRSVFFCDRIYAEETLPPEYKLFLPIQVKA
ncbi:hypothetical protein SELMODRAFT_130480 [Selaginella moellendorffii]|uniref:CFA20 domain-containing protein n=1 Tax=Selaginella moellendorffii TaxID=88036 RepID=D8T2G5_SELML|nr:cilia- and flagella-associated protein 20 [Selaginella moellendorffii]EFJ09051.1 hypothetical protein SELMODRAFT_130480 [Selaginella moellendorffii]|eukprot:XP_002989784.1 cilia- and flagella-associated protein 20 [Selaginella moellendorffii]